MPNKDINVATITIPLPTDLAGLSERQLNNWLVLLVEFEMYEKCAAIRDEISKRSTYNIFVNGVKVGEAKNFKI